MLLKKVTLKLCYNSYELLKHVVRLEMVMKRKIEELKAGMFWWEQAKCGQRDFGHEGTSGGRMNGEQCCAVSGPGSRLTASRGCLSSTNL